MGVVRAVLDWEESQRDLDAALDEMSEAIDKLDDPVAKGRMLERYESLSEANEALQESESCLIDAIDEQFFQE